ncbi:MAG: YezD family protein [Lysinibacillus sp.]
MADKKQENVNLAIKKVKEMLKTVNHGSITLTIQNAYVVQIEKKEKIRLK